MTAGSAHCAEAQSHRSRGFCFSSLTSRHTLRSWITGRRSVTIEQPYQSDHTPNLVTDVLTSPSQSPERRRSGNPRPRRIILFVSVMIAVIFIAVLALSIWWPFHQQSVLQDLQEASDSRVKVGAFHSTYFPYPGCILENVVFARDSNPKPLMTVQKLTLQGTYAGILARHLKSITADGMRITVPPFGTGPAFHTTRSPITIGQIVTRDAILEFMSRNADGEPLRFDIHEADLRDVGWKEPLTYRVNLHNPKPPGEISASGKFGVWDQQDAARTPVSGEYKFEKADLGVFEGIAGTLSSGGKFSGTLGHMDISGTTDVPDFNVKSGVNQVDLKTEFNAYVDAIHGDTFLKRVDAYFQKTHVVAQGSITRSDGKGRVALIELSTRNGRIEDILRLFSHEKRAPMAGAVTLTAKVTIPSGKQRFLRKVILRGDFGIGGGEFSNPSTQEGVDKLSAGARGEKDKSDPATVLSDLKGQVILENGVGNFTDLSFGVPGAAASMHGTYDLISHKIDLRGQMQVDSKISNTTTGGKALVLKMMEPFFKKHKQGEIVPVRISGTYDNPTFGLDFNDKRARQVTLPRSSQATAPTRHLP